MQTQELGMHYVSAVQSHPYNVFVCKIPQIESSEARYKLFVKES